MMEIDPRKRPPANRVVDSDSDCDSPERMSHRNLSSQPSSHFLLTNSRSPMAMQIYLYKYSQSSFKRTKQDIEPAQLR
jgi:hypothetical protein